MRFNKAFFVLLTIGVVCVMVVCQFYLSKRRSDSIQNLIQSTELVRVYAGKTSLNVSLTGNISEIWFSDEVTDGRVDIDSACAKYSMTDTETRAFTEHYSNYAVIDIPLKIVNSSDVTIGGFHLSFKNTNEKKSDVVVFRKHRRILQFGRIRRGGKRNCTSTCEFSRLPY